MCKSHRFVYCKLCLRRENYTLFASVCQQSDASTDNIRNAQRYGRRKRNMHVLFNTTKLYKKCVYKYRKRHYKRIFKKIIIVFTFIFLQNENLNNKKKEICCLPFFALEKIFSRGLFLTFCTVICPFAHRGWQRFFVANCLPQVTDKHDT